MTLAATDALHLIAAALCAGFLTPHLDATAGLPAVRGDLRSKGRRGQETYAERELKVA